MRVKFRQGVIRPYYSEILPGDPSIPSYLQKVGNTVAIRASFIDPIIVNFSHGTENYLYEETEDKEAWSSLITGSPCWLYWELDSDGLIQYGSTKIEPLVGLTPPNNPVPDQHFFSIPKKAMLVWSGAKNKWESKIRVFATKYEHDFTPNISNEFAENRSQVGLNLESNAGYLLYTDNGMALKDGPNFVTTNRSLKTQGSVFNYNKIATEKVDGKATQNIPIHNCVAWDGPQRQMRKASYRDVNNPAMGVTTYGAVRGQVRSFITQGYIHDPSRFNWEEDPNTLLFVGVYGELTTTPPRKISIQRMGYIVDRHTVYIDVGPQILIDPIIDEPEPEPEIDYETSIKCLGYETSIKCLGYDTSIKCLGYETSIKCVDYNTAIKCLGYATKIACEELPPFDISEIYDYFSFENSKTTLVQNQEFTLITGAGGSDEFSTDSISGLAWKGNGRACLRTTSAAWADLRGNSFLIWTWYKREGSSSPMTFIEKMGVSSAVFSVSVLSSGTIGFILRFSDSSSQVIDGGQLVDSEWQFYALGWDRNSGTMSAWVGDELIDSVVVATGTELQAPNAFNPTNQLGYVGTAGPSAQYFDEFGIATVVPNQSMVDWLYNQGNGRSWDDF